MNENVTKMFLLLFTLNMLIIFSNGIDEIDANSFLEKYGYLPKSNAEAGSIMSADGITQAIKDFQYNMNLQETGVLDRATKELMLAPRCGIPDVKRSGRSKRFSSKKGSAWSKTSLTWSFKSNKPANINSKVRRDLQDALSVWQDHTIFTFYEVNDNEPDILFEFKRLKHDDGFEFDGKGNTLAHAFYPKSGKVHFDDDEIWYFGRNENRDREGANLFDVAVHELGHTLGLEHSSVSEAVMIPIMKNDNRYQSLKNDDIEGIKFIYVKNRQKILKTESHVTRQYSTIKKQTKPITKSSRRSSFTKKSYNQPSVHRPIHNVPVILKIPVTCKVTSFDAITTFRGEIFIFKDQYVWRILRFDKITGPTPITSYFKDLPVDSRKINAVYENRDESIVFFIGRDCYIFDGKYLSGPKRLPSPINKVDGAFIRNGVTYIYSENQYWEFDENNWTVKTIGSKSNTFWQGVNARNYETFLQKNGKTYFFKGDFFYEYDDKTEKFLEKPQITSMYWMKCSNLKPKNYYSFADKNHISNVLFIIITTFLISIVQ